MKGAREQARHWEAEAARLTGEVCRLSKVLADVAGEVAPALVVHVPATVDAYRQEFRLYRATDPEGGLVLVNTANGARPWVTAHYLEDLYADVRRFHGGWSTGARQAIAALKSRVQTLCDGMGRLVCPRCGQVEDHDHGCFEEAKP